MTHLIWKKIMEVRAAYTKSTDFRNLKQLAPDAHWEHKELHKFCNPTSAVGAQVVADTHITDKRFIEKTYHAERRLNSSSTNM